MTDTMQYFIQSVHAGQFCSSLVNINNTMTDYFQEAVNASGVSQSEVVSRMKEIGLFPTPVAERR